MTPYATPVLPHEKEHYKQGYKDGYEAGKAALKKELKQLIATLNDKDVYSTSSATYPMKIVIPKSK